MSECQIVREFVVRSICSKTVVRVYISYISYTNRFCREQVSRRQGTPKGPEWGFDLVFNILHY